jgi:hypothetical protein
MINIFQSDEFAHNVRNEEFSMHRFSGVFVEFAGRGMYSEKEQKWIFLIGLGLIVLHFLFISGELTDKSN